MILHAISGLIFLYLLVRLILPLRVRAALKSAAGIALFAVSQQHLLLRSFAGSLASPEAPSWVLILQSLLFSTLLFLFLAVLARDFALLVRGIAKRAIKSQKPETPGTFSPGRRKALLLCLAALPAAYGIRQALALPETRAMETILPGLPTELDGLCIAHLSDLHIGPLLQESWSAALVEKINDLRPDLILFSGDIVDGLPSRRAKSVAHLKKLRATHGIFACVGNHEYYANFHAWMKVFPELGLATLLNSHRTVDIKGQKIVIAGITDPAAAGFGLPPPDCRAALRGAPENATRILLAHRPTGAEQNATLGFSLQLSGHTHGGQILGLDRFVAQFNGGYLRGWYKAGGMPLYVNSGAGLWSGFPLRLGVPSEIARITLRSA
ncbi:MAG: metallophosphoesterase [Desulfovibrio sp.]|jgi:predicted MPP superfamily phosphohydrolase|nr:metallophosphoesterase [Desulfovibrio sp.]